MFSSAAVSASASFVILPNHSSKLVRISAVRCSQNGSSPDAFQNECEGGISFRILKPSNALFCGASLKAKKGPKIMELPLEQIRRPLLRTRSNDPEKVKDLMASISEIGLLEPIDVLEVEGVYYGFSGCHRYEAHQRLGLPTIRCKIRKGTKDTLRHHLR